MNWKNIVTVYLKELKDSLRDRRTLISMIVVPTLVMPAIMFGVGTIMTKVMKQAREEGTSLIVLGGADSPSVVASLKKEKNFRVVTPAGDSASSSPTRRCGWPWRFRRASRPP